MSLPKVAVTGAAGNLGSRLCADLRRDHEVVAIDIHDVEHIVDCAVDLAALHRLFKGCETVIHLAGPGDNEIPWDAVHRDHIAGTYNAFEAARLAGCKRVIYPSSNHAVGEYEVDAPKPAVYEPGYGHVLTVTDPVRPDGLYGAAKCFGEALGRFYSDRFGLQVTNIRIGSTTRNDTYPDSEAGKTWTDLKLKTVEERQQRLASTWFSHRDFQRLIRAVMSRDVRYAIVYGVGDNPTRMWDLEPGRALFGFWPLDGSGSTSKAG